MTSETVSKKKHEKETKRKEMPEKAQQRDGKIHVVLFHTIKKKQKNACHDSQQQQFSRLKLDHICVIHVSMIFLTNYPP